MKRFFKFGCLGAIGLFVLLIIVGLIAGDSENNTAKDNESNVSVNETVEDNTAVENEQAENKASVNEVAKDITIETVKNVASIPSYTIEEENLQGSIWNVVLLTPSTDEKEIEALIKHTTELAKAKKDVIDAIFVKVNIKNSVANSYAASGKVALSDKGRAQTGLDKINDYEISITIQDNHLTSKEDLPQSQASYTSQDILKAFQTAGLPTTDSRENNHKCVDLECTSLITTEDVSIYEWPSAEIAKQIHEEKKFGDAQVGTIIIRMNNKDLNMQDYVKVLNGVTGK
ncbi:MAG: hypothetical protein ABS949_10815 [Solibacillus sp.]